MQVMVKRDLLHLIRNSEALMMIIFLPIMVTAVFVYIFGGALGPGGDRIEYLRYVLPGILVIQPAVVAYMTGVSVNNDMSKGIIDRFRTMDISQSSVLSGHIIASLVRNLMGAIIVILFAYAIGFRTDISILHWFATAAMTMLYILMISMISMMIGLLGSNVESVSGMMMFVQFMPYVSSAFIPTETMPKVLRYFADHQPITLVINTIRGLMLGTEIGSDWISAIIWCIGIIFICFIISKYTYEHRTSKPVSS